MELGPKANYRIPRAQERLTERFWPTAGCGRVESRLSRPPRAFANRLWLDEPPRRERCLLRVFLPSVKAEDVATGIGCGAATGVGLGSPEAQTDWFLPPCKAPQAQGASLPFPASILGDLGRISVRLVNTAGKSALYLLWGERIPARAREDLREHPSSAPCAFMARHEHRISATPAERQGRGFYCPVMLSKSLAPSGLKKIKFLKRWGGAFCLTHLHYSSSHIPPATASLLLGEP